MEKIIIGRIPVHLINYDILHSHIANLISEKKRKAILHSNAHLVQLANSKEQWLQDFFLNDVELVMCDGSGIQLAAYLTNQKIPEKIAYNIWFWEFAKFCSSNKFSIFLLGGKEEVVELAAKNLKSKNAELKLFYHHGYFNKNTYSNENKMVIDLINEIRPNILVVCFGMPLQEKYIKENINKLNVNIVMSAGGALDFFAGKSKVAPFVFRKFYLEWLYRLLLEPYRLFQRYLIGNFKFLYYAIKYKSFKNN